MIRFQLACMVVFVTMAAGCTVEDAARNNVEQRNEVDGRKLVGLTVADAAREAGLEPGTCDFSDEPPGVGCCISGTTLRGEAVHLWIGRNAGVFREDRSWTFKMFALKRVVRAVVEKDGRRKSWPE
jgi:hypothetical protein